MAHRFDFKKFGVACSVLAITTHGLQSTALACGSCRGPAGPGATVTAPWEKLGVAVSQSNRIVHGSWSDRGAYVPLGKGSQIHALDYTIAVGWRPWKPALELAAMLPYGYEILTIPGFSSQVLGLGDATVRAKWDILSDSMGTGPSDSAWPAVGVAFAMRMPTGRVDLNSDGPGNTAGPSSGTSGSTATSQGLGTWEFAVAADVRRTFATSWQVAVIGEGALRAPDASIGRPRQLGPRLLGRALMLYSPTTLRNTYTVGVFTDIAWEGDIAYNHTLVRGTSQRLWGVGAMVSLKIIKANLRTGLSVTLNPPVRGAGINALGATSVGLFLGYSR